MDEQRIFITADEAISVLYDVDGVGHTFKSSGGMIFGADWEITEIEKELREADKIEISGDMARGMRHGICVFPKGAKYLKDLIFVETNEDKLKALEESYLNTSEDIA